MVVSERSIPNKPRRRLRDSNYHQRLALPLWLVESAERFDMTIHQFLIAKLIGTIIRIADERPPRLFLNPLVPCIHRIDFRVEPNLRNLFQASKSPDSTSQHQKTRMASSARRCGWHKERRNHDRPQQSNRMVDFHLGCRVYYRSRDAVRCRKAERPLNEETQRQSEWQWWDHTNYPDTEHFHTFYGYSFIEFGFRDDGVVVWRKRP